MAKEALPSPYLNNASPLVASLYLVLFLTGLLIALAFWKPIQPGGDLFVGIAVPLLLLINSVIFAYNLVRRRYYAYLLLSIVLAAGLAGLLVYSRIGL